MIQINPRVGVHSTARPGGRQREDYFWGRRCDNRDDGVGDEKDGGGDEGVVLQEAGDQGEADDSHHRVGKDEDNTFDDGAETALLFVLGCDLVFRNPFRQRDD